MKKYLFLFVLMLAIGCLSAKEGDRIMNDSKVKVRFQFVHVFASQDTPNTNTYEVFIDNKLVFKDRIIDDTDGHKYLNRIIEIEKGKHLLEVRYEELKSSAKIGREFDKNIGFQVISYGDSYKNLKLEEFPFDKVFLID